MIPKAAIDLILQAEGIDQPWKWPGGRSGITIGYGYDLGFETNFAQDWAGQLTSGAIQTLSTAIGVRGQHARAIAPRFRGIVIAQSSALSVFTRCTLPDYEKDTLAAFPGLDKLPDLVRGALVSLVFNRGASMVGDRRAEMRAIRDAVAKGDIEEIARQLRAMKHIWEGEGLDGLLARRDAEASLVELATASPSSGGQVVDRIA
jgi:GH24 family phage-related lysozyme (muramidase)